MKRWSMMLNTQVNDFAKDINHLLGGAEKAVIYT